MTRTRTRPSDVPSSRAGTGTTSAPLRVLIAYDFEGVENHVTAPNFYRAAARQVLPKLGMEVSFPPLLARGRVYRTLTWAGVSESKARLVQFALWFLLHRSQFDVVFGWLGNGVVAALLRAAFRWRSPGVCLVLYRWPSQPGLGGRIRRAILRMAAAGASTVVALDSGQARLFGGRSRRPERCRSLRYGVDATWYAGLLPGRTPGGCQRPTIFVPGSAHRDERVVRAALSVLNVTVIRCRLDAPAASATSERVGSAVFEDHGALPYPEYVRRCCDADVVVIAVESHDKPVGLTALLECMALGRPIVITDGMSSRDYVEDGRTALTYRQGDARQLRSHVERLLAEPEFAASLGSAARDVTRERLSLSECGMEMAEIIREAAPR